MENNDDDEYPDFVEVNRLANDVIRDSTRADAEPLDRENLDDWTAAIIEGIRSQEVVKQVEHGFQIHYVEEIEEEIHQLNARLLDTTPENLMSSGDPSKRDGYDKKRTFTLSRNGPDDPWTVPRFSPSTCIEEAKEIVEDDNLKIVLLAAPFQ